MNRDIDIMYEILAVMGIIIMVMVIFGVLK
jgi:hypothetical protein